jgi:glycosyltransferase involved in cell wall biosynthesis
MFEYVERSPFRRFFQWIVMPAIDSSPQPAQWISTYLSTDALLAYCEFGKDEIDAFTGLPSKVLELAPPSADYSIFCPPEDKKIARDKLGIMPNINIVGTVMRNQRRKLYPDLFISFRDFCIAYPTLSEDTFLYAHTAFPDIGWNIPELLKRYDIGHKVLFTYMCRSCGHFFPSFFHDAVQSCPKCKKPNARMPDPDHGVQPAELAQIMKCFDLYVQYSSAGGFEMPIAEAAACGVPVMAIDYSGMGSVLRNVDGIRLPYLHLNLEPEGHYYRAIPDNKALVLTMAKFFRCSKAEQLKIGMDSYKACRKNYSWDKTAKVWERAIDSVPVHLNANWEEPARFTNTNVEIPGNLSNEEFVRFCVANIWGQPDKVDGYMALRMIRDLNYGKAMIGHGGLNYNEMSSLGVQQFYSPFGRSNVFTELKKMATVNNSWEQVRCGLAQDSTPKFIEIAHKRNKD